MQRCLQLTTTDRFYLDTSKNRKAVFIFLLRLLFRCRFCLDRRLADLRIIFQTVLECNELPMNGGDTSYGFYDKFCKNYRIQISEEQVLKVSLPSEGFFDFLDESICYPVVILVSVLLGFSSGSVFPGNQVLDGFEYVSIPVLSPHPH